MQTQLSTTEYSQFRPGLNFESTNPQIDPPEGGGGTGGGSPTPPPPEEEEEEQPNP
jgi:hypothetical protein